MAVVVEPPCGDLGPGVVQAFEDLGVEALVAEAALEGLHEAVFRGLAGPDEVELHAPLEGPGVERLRGELGAVVSGDDGRQMALGGALEQLGNALAGEADPSLKHLA